MLKEFKKKFFIYFVFKLKVFCELNKEELEQGGKAILNMMAGSLMSEFDKDGDGKLTKDEFIAAFDDISK